MKKVEEYNDFQCLECKDKPVMDHSGMVKHLKDVHGIKDKIKGSRNLLMHIDGEDYSFWEFEWVLDNGMRLYQSSCNKRKR